MRQPISNVERVVLPVNEPARDFSFDAEKVRFYSL